MAFTMKAFTQALFNRIDEVHTDRLSEDDVRVLREIEANAPPKAKEQPKSYDGWVVLKPWGYEFQVSNDGMRDIWLLCIKPGKATSLHCHKRKHATFFPLTDGVTFRTLAGADPLEAPRTVSPGVFHGQENNTARDVFFLEYETPAEKSDLVRYSDRYGRVGQGYEGVSNMISFTDFILGRHE